MESVHLFNIHPTPRTLQHSYIANGLGGKNNTIVIDMQNFKSITYSNTTQTASIGVGNRLGEVVFGLLRYGRALPHGTCAYVGFGGHASYGGYGFTSRLWGLTVDNIVAADVVLANGTIVHASSEHGDLFWALRGAAPSFGIVTSYTLKTYTPPPSTTIFSYNWQLPARNASRALSLYQSFSTSPSLPSAIALELVLTPGNNRGYVSVGLAGGWYGDVNRLNATLAPFLNNMEPFRERNWDTGDYLNSAKNLAGGSLDTTAPGGTDTFYAKSLVIKEGNGSAGGIGEGAAQGFMRYLANEGFDSPIWWFIQVGLMGGRNSAIRAVPANETSYAHHDALFTIQFYASSTGNVPPYPESGFKLLDGMVDSIVKNSPANWDYGAYTNYIDDRLQNADTLYYKQNLERLRSLKSVLDPQGVFDFPVGVRA